MEITLVVPALEVQHLHQEHNGFHENWKYGGQRTMVVKCQTKLDLNLFHLLAVKSEANYLISHSDTYVRAPKCTYKKVVKKIKLN